DRKGLAVSAGGQAARDGRRVLILCLWVVDPGGEGAAPQNDGQPRGQQQQLTPLMPPERSLRRTPRGETHRSMCHAPGARTSCAKALKAFRGPTAVSLYTVA